MICTDCGCDEVEPRTVEGFEISECQLCGALLGESEEIRRIEEIREGREQGYEPGIYPLVKTIGMITGYKVVAASEGVGPKGAPPFVTFKIHGPKSRALLERVMQSLTMANRRLNLPWTIEVTLVRGLTFTLIPRLERAPEKVTQAVVRACRADVDLISSQLRRDMNLSWWGEVADDD